MQVQHVQGDREIEISQVTLDSRIVGSGALFIALRGTQQDGHIYIPVALESGAVAVLAETPAPDDLPQGVTWVQVEDTRQSLALVANNTFDRPSRDLRLVGVTGTNGKTSVVSLLYQVFTDLGYRCGLLSTVVNQWPGHLEKASLTTPDLLTTNAALRDMADAGCDVVFMEVSSHAVDQGRIDGLHFTGGVFTNLTHDHLDYHGTFKAYLEAKKGFFDRLPKGSFALVNSDDRNGRVMVQNTSANVLTYAMRQLADIKGKLVECRLAGMDLKINDRRYPAV